MPDAPPTERAPLDEPPGSDGSDGFSGSASATPLPGATFAGRYRVEACIGSGGMGELFRAFDVRLQRRVALKVLRRDRGEVALLAGHMLREARAAAVLNHPNVVGIYDVGEHEGIPFFAMEYVEGPSMRGFVGLDRPPFETRLGWLIDVARALAAAHAKGLIHRDVKPDNVMIGDDGIAKVLDFGIAHYRGASTEAAPDAANAANAANAPDAPNANGAPLDVGDGAAGRPNEAVITRLVGTPGYMAPEQIRAAVFDARADQFGWGVTAYELFSGKLPWADDPSTLMKSVLTTETKLLANVPVNVARVVQRALEKDARARHDSMADIVSVLEAAYPLVTGSRSRQVRRMRVAPRTLVLGALALSAALFFGIAISNPVVKRPARAFSAAESASAAPVGTTVVALPISPTCNKTAEAFFREGLMAQRQATWELAYTAFEKGAAADPACPEVQLQLALTGTYLVYSLNKEREAFRRALAMRDVLGERDRVLLDAFVPLVTSEPADHEETSRRLEAAAIQFPRDAQILIHDGVAHMASSPDVATAEHCVDLARRATDIDPKYADGWQLQGRALVYLGRFDDAMAAFDKCLEVAPGSTDCIEERIRDYRRSGACADAVADARRWIARVPQGRNGNGYLQLANALASNGASAESVDTVLQQSQSHDHTEGRETSYSYYRALSAAQRGDFANVEKIAAQLLAQLRDSPTLVEHARASVLLVELLNETGRKEQAATVAEQFFQQRDAWTEGPWNTVDNEPTLLAALLLQGKISHEQWRASSELWEKRALSTLSKHQAWAFRWGPVSRTRAVAAEAWGELPAEPPTAGSTEPRMYVRSLGEILKGRVALVAGENASAVELLEPATKSCDDLEQPFANTRAHLWLGEAKERLGDRAGACEAYQVVLRRWANAKPRSVTADEAEGHARALGCKRDAP